MSDQPLVYVQTIQLGNDIAFRYLRLSDGRCLGPFDASSVLACNVVQGCEFTEALLNCLLHAEQLRTAKELALSYLAYANRTAWEVRRYLARNQVAQEIRQEILDWLLAQQFINDDQLASYLVQRAAEFGGKDSAKALAAKLVKRGIKPASVTRVLTEEGYDELPAARVLAAKKWAELQRKQSPKPRLALAGYLSRKGFSNRTIHKVLAEWREKD